MLAVYMDPHVPAAITDGLRGQGIVVLTAFEDGHADADDPVLVARATRLGRSSLAGKQTMLQYKQLPLSPRWDEHAMPMLVIDDVPAPLYDRIQRLALDWERTPAATVLKLLEAAIPATMPNLSERSLLREPFLTDEICAPFTLPRPKGERVVPIEIAECIPSPYDLPDAE